MKRLQFDSQGKLSGLDGNEVERKEESRYKPEINLKKSDSLEFLKEDSPENLEDIFEKDLFRETSIFTSQGFSPSGHQNDKKDLFTKIYL